MRTRQVLTGLVALCLGAGLLIAPPAAAAAPAPGANPDSVTLAGETSTLIDVLANDTVTAPAVLSVPVSGEPGAPEHGTSTPASVTTGGVTRPAVSYRPDPGWFGSDSFDYTVSDASGLSATSVVSVIVTPVAPTAAADTASVAPGDSVRVAVLENDSDPYGRRLTVTSVTAGRHGATSVIDSGRAIRYSPAAGWSGDDAFTYAISSSTGATATGTVSVTTLSSPGHEATLSAPAQVIVLRRTSLTGVVSPYDGALPTVQVQVRVGSDWSTFASVTPSDLGSFTAPWLPDRPGVARLRALAVWPDGSSAASATVTSTVVGLADPVVSGPLRRADVPYSFRPGCPLGPASLRRLSINYWDYSGRVRRGDVVLAVSAVRAVRRVLTTAFTSRFRIKVIAPVDSFYRGGRVSPTQSDISAMNAGNTSAFNCRKVTGSRYRISQHSYGNAIDVNTYENPYATSSRIYPAAAAHRYYVMRRFHLRDIGVIAPRSVLARAFAAQHWLWGARWSRHDYQHFSANGG